VEKGGEIIPKIVGIDLSLREGDSQKITFIDKCPECGTGLVREENEANHYCPNDKNCPPQIKGKIEHFISRKAMNIDGLGEETVDLLFREGLINSVADLYNLSIDHISSLERMGEKSATNIISSIQSSLDTPFERVLYALGIRHIGETVAKILVKHFRSLENIIDSTIEEKTEVPEIGDKIAQSLHSWLTDIDNITLLNRLKEYGLKFTSEEVTDQKGNQLNGKSIVVSGLFTLHSRDEYKMIIEEHGGKNVSSISSKTSFILAGENMGPSKKSKAKELGIEMLTEDEFWKLLNNL
jgi:DNA ligase (NAD+)